MKQLVQVTWMVKGIMGLSLDLLVPHGGLFLGHPPRSLFTACRCLQIQCSVLRGLPAYHITPPLWTSFSSHSGQGPSDANILRFRDSKLWLYIQLASMCFGALAYFLFTIFLICKMGVISIPSY